MKEHRILSEGGPIDDLFGPVTSETVIEAIEVHFSSAPATAGTLAFTRDSAKGGAFNTVLYSLDPSAGSITDVANGALGFRLNPGDALRTTYANADGRTIGITLQLR